MGEAWYADFGLQFKFIDGLGKGKRMNHVLSELNILPETFAAWLKQPLFREALELRLAELRIDSAFLLSRHSYAAAEKLVEFMNEGNDNRQFKACVEVLRLCRANRRELTVNIDAAPRPTPFIDEDKARRVLLEAAKRH